MELLATNEDMAPFTAVLVMDGAERPGYRPDVSDDWALLGANLPDVVAPFPWGILDESEVTRARAEGSPFRCSGAGYPTTGPLNKFKWVRGHVTDAAGRGTGAYLAMAVDASDNLNANPEAFSGGPMALGEVIFGMFSTSTPLGSAIVGNAEVGGTRRARPLQPIMARVAEKFAGVGTPCPILELPADDDVKQMCIAAQALAAHALSTGTLAALDGACATVLGTLVQGLPTGHMTALLPSDGKPAQPHTFVRAVQRLLRLPKGDEPPLARMLRGLAAQFPAVHEAFGSLLAEPVNTAAPPLHRPRVEAAASTVVLDAVSSPNPVLGPSRSTRLNNFVIDIAKHRPIVMIALSGGTYSMGSSQREGLSTELPPHEVTLSSFHISETLLTNAQYKGIDDTHRSHFSGLDNPVESVNWFDAISFLNKLSIKNGLTPVYSFSHAENGRILVEWDRRKDGYRLPTEAEWEYACRAGASNELSADGRPQVAWFRKNSGETTHPVGGLHPNHWGLFDMHGNVCEWVWDRFDPDWYTSSPLRDPSGPSTGASRVLKGGSWSDPASRVRAAYRTGSPPDTRSAKIGFRVARGIAIFDD